MYTIRYDISLVFWFGIAGIMYLYKFGKIDRTLKIMSVGQNEVHTGDMDKVIPAKCSESKCAFDGNTAMPLNPLKIVFCVY